VELSDLKSKVFTLLKEDEEFRYAVAGMLGFEEILRRLERHDKRFEEILHRLDRHEAELIKLREDMILGFKRHDEILEKHTQELIKLREDMISGFKRHDEILERHANEIAKLREDMISGFRRHDDVLEKHARELVKLREDMISEFKKHDEILEKHANEITKLREDMISGFKRHDEILEKHAQELVKLREDFNVMLKVIGQIQEEQRRISEGQYRLEKRVDSLESAMISGFGEMSKFAGLTFEEFVRKFLSASLKRSGEIPEGAELVKGFINGEEINIFLEDPLIVGEATSYAESANEIMKLLRKAEIAKAKYSKEPRKILVILTAKSDAAKEIIRIAKEKGVELVIGKIVD
jgi:predicted secreted Zn-dependent protease/TusA-related sulfurtransferase